MIENQEEGDKRMTRADNRKVKKKGKGKSRDEIKASTER